MKKKIITSFLMVALSHYFVGCMFLKDVPERDFEKLVNSRHRASSAVLNSGILIEFNKEGGAIIREERGIYGKSGSADPIWHLVKNTKQMFKMGTDEIVSHRQLVDDDSIRISKLVTLDDKEVIFGPEGGKYLLHHDFLNGISSKDAFIKVGVEDLRYVIVSELEWKSITTMLYFIGSIAITAVLLYLLLLGIKNRSSKSN